MILLLSFALAMLVTSAALPVLRSQAERLGLVDVPLSARKVHTVNIPHSGGVAIVLGVVIAVIGWLPREISLLPLLVCFAIVVVFGLLDDLRDLSYRSKLAGQVAASALLLTSYGGFTQLPFFELDAAPQWLCLAFSFVFLIAITNAINLSDGLDGLAAGNGLLSLILLAIFAVQIEADAYLVLTLALAGGLVGFLRFNTHPASIFMGDTGSQFIGFAAGALCILILRDDQLPFSALLPILLFGLPILDTLTVMAIRKAGGRPMFSADRSHLHHQLMDLGFRHYEVVIVLYFLQAICIGLGFQLRYSPDWQVLCAYLAYCVVVLGVILGARYRGWKLRPESKSVAAERRNMFLRGFGWYYRNTSRVLAPVLGGLFVIGTGVFGTSSQALSDMAFWVGSSAIASWVLLRRYPGVIVRLVSYTACVAATWCALSSTAGVVDLLWLDLVIVLLALALILAIRVTRSNRYSLNNQDYLILLIVAAAPLLMPSGIEGALGTRAVIYLAVLLYASEYVAAKGNMTRPALTSAGIVSILLLAV